MTDSGARALGASGPCVLVLAFVPGVREGLTGLLEAAGFRSIAAASAADAFPQILLHRPDVALVDIRLPGSTAVEFCRTARTLLAPLRFLLLSSYDDHRPVQEAVLAGASGLVLRELRSEPVVSAVRLTVSGNQLLDKGVRSKVIQDFFGAALGEDTGGQGLTPTENRLLALVAEGMDDESIGRHIPVSRAELPKTLRRALSKLGIDPLDHTTGL